MAETSRPWNGTTTGDATEAPYDANTEWAEYMAQSIGLGVTRADVGVVLGNGSGQLDSLQVTQNSPAGMSVLLNIGTALVYGTTYENDSALTLAITANASGNSRIDTIVLRKSWISQTVRAVVLTGTPAASPTPPSLTQILGVTWEIPIADILVANAAVSISNSNITSRAVYANAADGVYLDRLLNNSGATLESGTAVNLDSSADRAVTSTAASGATRLNRVGVWQGRSAAAGIGRAVNRGITKVRTSASVTIGQYCNVDVGVGTFSSSTSPTLFTVGRFLETVSGAGFALAWVDFGQAAQFGHFGTTQLAAPATSVSVSTAAGANLPYSTLEVEFFVRTVLAATNENILLTLGAGGVLVYYSYNVATSNSTPAMSAVQNLDATDAVIFNGPAASAPAGVFAYGRVMISSVLAGSSAQKHISGHYSYRITNVNGGLLVAQIGGWVTGVNMGAIALSAAGGGNLDTGSYINVYAKQTV